MWNTSSLPLFPGPLEAIVVVPDRVPSMNQIEIYNHILYVKPFNYDQTNDWLIELLLWHRNIWNRLTQYKQMNNVE